MASDGLNEANIEMRTGIHVTEIKPEAHTLMLTGGEHVVWDKLMIATGGRATTRWRKARMAYFCGQ